MAGRYVEDYDPEASGDSERLVINFTPFTPHNNGHNSEQHGADNTDVADQNCSHVDSDDTTPRQHENTSHTEYNWTHNPKGIQDTTHSLATNVSSSGQSKAPSSFLIQNFLPPTPETKTPTQELPSIFTIINGSKMQPKESAQPPRNPLSFWDIPDYSYTLDCERLQHDNNHRHSEPAATFLPLQCSMPLNDVTSGYMQPVITDTFPNELNLMSNDNKAREDEARQRDAYPKKETPSQIESNGAVTEKSEPTVMKVSKNPYNEKKKYQRYSKPPYSYASMSIMAIENSPNKALQYREIADEMRLMFPTFFNGEYQGWQRSVRHMLSRLDCFFYEKGFDKARSCFRWKVDLTKVKSEWFMRQTSKADLKKTEAEHEYKPYLHQQLNVAPIILPERHSVDDSASTASDVSRAIRNVLVQHQQVGSLDMNDSESSSTSGHGVVLPTKPSNYRLNSLSTQVSDADDFLGAKAQADKLSAEELMAKSDSKDEINSLEDIRKDLGLPTYTLDSPIASPIPHDVYRDTEGPERYCPSVESSAPVPKPPESCNTSRVPQQQTTNSQSGKRRRESSDMTSKKKPRTSPVQHQLQQSSTSNGYSNQHSEIVSSAYPYVHPNQQSYTFPMWYPSTDLYQTYSASPVPCYPPVTYETDKPLCWPPTDKDGFLLPPAGNFPSVPFGYTTELFPWYQQTGYPYQNPVANGYPTYDTQHEYQQYSNEASRWYRVPEEVALNLSVKPDS